MEAPAAPAAPAAPDAPAVIDPSGQPASGPERTDTSDASIDAWIRDKAFGSRSTLTPAQVFESDGADGTPSDESAPPGPGTGDVSSDGEAEAAPQGVRPTIGRRSQRAQADRATIEGLRSEIEGLRSAIPEAVAAAQQQAEAARAEAEALRAEQSRAEAEVYDLIGTADEYARLLEIPDSRISNEDYRKREDWKANRQVYRPLQERYRAEEEQRAHRAMSSIRDTWAKRVLSVADRYGLDRAFIADPKNSDIASLIEHACTVTEQRVRAEQSERLSQAERDRDAARGRALGARGPVVTNGRASSGTDPSTGPMSEINQLIRRRAGFA